MITYSAAGFWIDAISGFTPQIREHGELSPEIQDAKMPRCQDAKMPRCQDAKMPRCQDAKMPRCQDAKMPRCQDAKIATRRNRTQSVWSAMTRAPIFLTRQAARLVPASLNAAFAAHTKSRALANDIKRLEDLGPHLLKDIGIEQVSASVYAMIEASEPVVETLPAQTTAIRSETVPERRTVKATPKQAWMSSTKRLSGDLTGAVMS